MVECFTKWGFVQYKFAEFICYLFRKVFHKDFFLIVRIICSYRNNIQIYCSFQNVFAMVFCQ